MTVAQFLTSLKKSIMNPSVKPVRIRPSGYAVSTRGIGHNPYPRSTPSLAKSKTVKYVP